MELLQYALAGIIFLYGTYAVFQKPLHIIYIGFFLTLLGQLARLPLPITEIGVLISDLFLPYVMTLWFAKKIFIDRRLPRSYFGKYIIGFLVAAVFSILFNILGLPTSELISSSFYLVRLIAYFLYFFLCIEELSDPLHQKKLIQMLFLTALGLGIAGIIQYIFVPDFTAMAEFGWDPHIGRLLSTWYDPNYIAGFFAIIIGLLLSFWLYKKQKWMDWYTMVLTVFLLGCFALTFSRSGLVALGIVILIIGLIKARPVLIAGLLVGLVVIGFNDRAQERALGLLNSSLSFVTGSLDYDLDATSKLRVESWKQSLVLIDGSYLYGIGYNTIQYKKLTKGLIVDTSIHSGSGSDSSLLNIFITMGVLGLFAYCLLLWNIFSISIRLLWIKGTSIFSKGIALGTVCMWSALIVHSFFVNSLLLPFFILILIPLLALLDHQWKTRSV